MGAGRPAQMLATAKAASFLMSKAASLTASSTTGAPPAARRASAPPRPGDPARLAAAQAASLAMPRWEAAMHRTTAATAAPAPACPVPLPSHLVLLQTAQLLCRREACIE